MRTLWVGLLIIAAALASACVPRHSVLLSGEGLQGDPQVVHGVLDNGFQYLLMENQTPKDRVIVHLNVFAGSVHETDEEQGIAHYLEHLLFNGSEHFKPGELISYFQSIGMDFGGDANARTSFFNTVYDLNLPKGNREYLDKGLLVIQDYAKGALLLEEEVDRERGIILAEKRERDSASFRAFKKSLAFELPDSLVAKRFPIGTTQVISSADRALLKGFYDRWYRPDNMLLVMVGDFDVDEVKSMVEERFSALTPRGPNHKSTPDISWTPHKGMKYFYDYESETGNTTVTIEQIHQVPFEADTLDGLKARVLSDMADTVLQIRLNAMVRSQTAGFTSASVYAGRFLQQVYAAAVVADCAPDKWEQSLGQLEQALEQMLAFGADPRELDRVKAEFLTSLETGVNQADTRKSADLARGLLGSVNNKQVFMSPAQRMALLKPFIDGITLEELNQAFRQNWAQNHRLVMVTGNANLTGRELSPEKIIQQVYTASAANTPEPYAQMDRKAFPYLDLAVKKAGVVKMETDVAGLGITTLDFANNIRVNLKQTQFKKGRFIFKAAFGDGRASQPLSLPGLYLLAQPTLSNSGLGEMNPDELAETLAGRDADIGFAVGENHFALSGAASPDEIELTFQLIQAYTQDPGFREEALELAKKIYRQQYEAMVRTPDGMMTIQGARDLAGGDPRFGLPTPEALDQVNLDQIRNWLTPAFARAPMEISVVGDFDMDEMIETAKAYVGSMSVRDPGTKEIVFRPGKVTFPKGATFDIDVDSRIDKGMLQVVFGTDDFWDIQQTRRFSILSQVLSERLRKVIREKLGATYSPYGYNDPSLADQDYGTLHLVVNIKPGTEKLVRESIEEILTELRDKGIPEDEVELTLKPVVSHLAELRERNSYWLNSVLNLCRRNPQRLEWAHSILEGYASINAKELMSLVDTYLKPGYNAVIQVLPKK